MMIFSEFQGFRSKREKPHYFGSLRMDEMGLLQIFSEKKRVST